MSAQYDFFSGLDLSSLASASQAQIMQAINQIAPLSNIGGIIYGTATPDVASNPRFARYAWIDTNATPYTLKTYNGAAWVASTVAANAVSAATQIVDNIIPFSKFLKSEASAKQVLHKNAANTAFEYVNPTSLFTAGSNEILLTFLDKSAAAEGQILAIVSGAAAWSTLNLSTLGGTLPLSKLTAGTTNWILASPGGIPTYVSNDDVISSFLAAGGATTGIALSKLYRSAAGTGDLIKWGGGNWVAFTPTVDLTQAVYTITSNDDLGTSVHTLNHAFNSQPKLVRAVAVCTSAELGFVLGDEVELFCFVNAVNAVITFSVVSDIANTVIAFSSTANAPPTRLVRKDTHVLATIDTTKWKPKAYFWK